MSEVVLKRIRDVLQFGAGRGPRYRPWLTVQTKSSWGLVSRAPSRAAGRLCHLFSDLECQHFLRLDFARWVIDFREQYPLLPREEVQDLASTVRARFSTPRSKALQPYVHTTDFLVSTPRGERAIAVKYDKELAKPHVQRVLEVERRYWTARGVPFWVATERGILPQVTANLAFLCPPADMRAGTPQGTARQERCVGLFEFLKDGAASLSRGCRHADVHFGWGPGTALTLAREELRWRRWETDLASGVLPVDPLKGLTAGDSFLPPLWLS